MFYLMKPRLLHLDPRVDWEAGVDTEETLCRRHAMVAVLHLMFVLGVAWSLVLSCL